MHSLRMMTDGGNDWCTIESDPGVFTSLIESFGVKNVELTELWSLDDDSLRALTNPMDGVENVAVHGLIFLFKWQSSPTKSDVNGVEERTKALTCDEFPPSLFFAKQVTQNACATQAILSVLLSAPNAILTVEGSGENEKMYLDDDNGRRLILGSTLSHFKSFTSHFPPELRGEAIGCSEEIRAAHNSFGRAEESLLNDPSKKKRQATEDDDVFHFVAYVPCQEDGNVYELDGLKPGPIRVGSYTNKQNSVNDSDSIHSTMRWIHVARDDIQNRLSNYSSADIKFNLMAMVQDRRTYLTERLNALIAIGVEESDPAMLTVRSELHAEEEKRTKWEIENERRRHNYLPFCVEYLRCLAGCGKFKEILSKAKKSAGDKRKRAEAWKK